MQKTIILIGFNAVISDDKLKPGDDAESVKIIESPKLPLITLLANKILLKETLKRRKG